MRRSLVVFALALSSVGLGASPVNEQCVGRFRFAIPRGMTYEGGALSIFRVDVRTEALPSGGVPALWQRKLEELKRLKIPRGATGPVFKELELSPGVRAAWFYTDADDSRYIELVALRAVEGRAVWANRGAYGDVAMRERPMAAVEQLVTNVLSAYLPRTDFGFCVGPGAITTEPGTNESTRIVLHRPDVTDFELHFESYTVGRPEDHLLDDFEEEEGLKIIRQGRRTAATLKGREILMSLDFDGKPPSLLYIWQFPGEVGHSDRPFIEFRAWAPAKYRHEFDEAWELALRSLHPIPIVSIGTQAPAAAH